MRLINLNEKLPFMKLFRFLKEEDISEFIKGIKNQEDVLKAFELNENKDNDVWKRNILRVFNGEPFDTGFFYVFDKDEPPFEDFLIKKYNITDVSKEFISLQEVDDYIRVLQLYDLFGSGLIHAQNEEIILRNKMNYHDTINLKINK